jgi:hypothetical protein
VVTVNVSLRYEVPVMAITNIAAVWDVMYSKLVAMYQPFGGTCCLYLSDESAGCICPKGVSGA